MSFLLRGAAQLQLSEDVPEHGYGCQFGDTAGDIVGIRGLLTARFAIAVGRLPCARLTNWHRKLHSAIPAVG